MVKPRKRKTYHACVYCRRSHMTCGEARPCERCVRRKIGHLCHDEPKAKHDQDASYSPSVKVEDQSGQSSPCVANGEATTDGNGTWPLHPHFNEEVQAEFASLNEFLTLMEDDMFFDDPALQTSNGTASNGTGSTTPANSETASHLLNIDSTAPTPLSPQAEISPSMVSMGMSQAPISQSSRIYPQMSRNTSMLDVRDVSAHERFMLTAADPVDGSAAGRLREYIEAKVKAGLLKPYNYAQGYDRLGMFMDQYMNEQSKYRILRQLSAIRPQFRAVAQSLNDHDMVVVEERFERMLLEYDRIFSSVAVPACLWRRTGEIYRGNREFAEIVECRPEDLRDGKLAIYELLSEDSAVSYWEMYRNVAFNTGQKAVVTSCTLRTREGRKRKQCCFSFTVRRDQYNIPILIVGNFIPVQQPL